MLPDYPRIKDKLVMALTKRIQARSTPQPFDSAKHQHYYEGDRHRLLRADGSVADGEFQEVSGTLSLDLLKPEGATMEDVIARIDEVAEHMRSQLARHLYQDLSETIEQVGNVVDAGGRPFTAELYLEGLSKIELGFNEDGTPHLPTLVCPPAMRARVEAERKRIYREPQLLVRFDEVIQQKKEEWREREASRKLVG